MPRPVGIATTTSPVENPPESEPHRSSTRGAVAGGQLPTSIVPTLQNTVVNRPRGDGSLAQRWARATSTAATEPTSDRVIPDGAAR